jgi:hypothetical protein
MALGGERDRLGEVARVDRVDDFAPRAQQVIHYPML